MALGHVFVVVIGRLQSVKNTLVEVAKDFGVADVLMLRLAFNPHSCGASRHRFLFYSSWMPPVKRHWEHLEAQRPDMSKKAESAQLDFEGRGAQQIPSCLNMRTRSWGQMIGCFFYDSACCAHDLSVEARLPKVLQTFINPIRTSSRCGGGRNGQPDFSQRAAGML